MSECKKCIYSADSECSIVGNAICCRVAGCEAQASDDFPWDYIGGGLCPVFATTKKDGKYKRCEGCGELRLWVKETDKCSGENMRWICYKCYIETAEEYADD